MKTISSALSAHFGQEVTTLASCWRLIRKDGEEFFFTDHDEDITYDGDTYEADKGMVPLAVAQTETLAVDNTEAMAFLDTTKISESDIRAGLFDYATLDIFLVNYEDTTMGEVYIAQDWHLGRVEIRDNAFQAEARSKAQKLQQTFVELYQPGCRATLGDTRCGIDLDDSAGTYRHDGVVTSVASARKKFTDTSAIDSGAADVFRAGKIVWSTPASADSYDGNNASYEMEVKKFDPTTGEFTLFLPMPNDIEVDDEFTAYWGCDKDMTTCRDTYNNLDNFRGEPYVVGTKKITAFDLRRWAKEIIRILRPFGTKN